jgi:hypothetical protein
MEIALRRTRVKTLNMLNSIQTTPSPGKFLVETLLIRILITICRFRSQKIGYQKLIDAILNTSQMDLQFQKKQRALQRHLNKKKNDKTWTEEE